MTKFTDSLWACLLNLEEHHSRVDGWRPSDSATPNLYFLYQKTSEIVADEVIVPRWTWEVAGSLGQFLRRIARLMEKHGAALGRLVHPAMVGVGVVCEGWGLSASEEQDVERVAKSRRIHQHPNRRETRMVIAAPLTRSMVFTVMRYRRYNEIIKFPDGENPPIDGAVPDALRFFAQTVALHAPRSL